MNPNHLPQLPYQVSELLAQIHLRLDMEFGAVQVEGEVSGLTQARSGHRYFSLKDADGQLRCAWFRNSIRGQNIREGQKVVAHGHLAVYSPRGDLQFIVRSVEDSGEGALAAAFQKLKKKLEAEGLFDPARKLALPPNIRRIAIVSSPQAAALQDVLVTLRRRDPFMNVVLSPVSVQGLSAPQEISDAIRSISGNNEVDALLLTRGGGSLEDLQAYNSEVVARAIADCQIPVVSAVGHETDFSISDFVASLRAATPTAAAELLSKDRSLEARAVPILQNRLRRALRQSIARAQGRKQELQQRLQRQSPLRRLTSQTQQLDSLTKRLHSNVIRQLNIREQHFDNLQTRLHHCGPQKRLIARHAELVRLQQNLQQQIDAQLLQSARRTRELKLRLHSLGPNQVLNRGYAIVHQDDTVIERASQLKDDVPTQIQWSDGTRIAKVGKLFATRKS